MEDTLSVSMQEPIYDELSNIVKRDEQAIILLNRKGYSTYLYCQQCGALAECVNCSVGLVSFKSKNKSLCYLKYFHTLQPYHAGDMMVIHLVYKSVHVLHQL